MTLKILQTPIKEHYANVLQFRSHRRITRVSHGTTMEPYDGRTGNMPDIPNGPETTSEDNPLPDSRFI
jgi:hypothetical protein